MLVYTSICMNYLPKALTLGKSLKKTNKDVKFFIVLLEREIPDAWPKEADKIVDKVILAKDLGFDDFDKFIFKHSIVEASTSVKGHALVHLMENYDEKVLYIDPDIKVYSSLKELSNILDQHSVILTPHLTIPEQNEIDINNNELCALQHGVYNLGFVGVKNDEDGMKFARWWRDRLSLYCYDDIPRGIFTDQRWCDLAPAYFDVYIMKNPGYNMAPWNLSTRKITYKNGKILVNDKYELIFFHYSGFDSGANQTVFDYYVPDKKNYIYKLRNEYIDEMNENGQKTLGNYSWSYDCYFNNQKIDRNIRIQYRDAKLFETIDINPFSLSNEHLTYLLNNTLVEPKEQESKSSSNLRNAFRKILPLKLRKGLKKLIKL